MGKAWSSVTRFTKNINIENRAHRAIDTRKKQPLSAPRHDTTKDLLNNFSAEHPEYLNEQQKKDHKLLHNLKDMKVDSFGAPPEIRSSRPLPENRSNITDLEYGVQEPANIPIGKVSLRQAIEIITHHSRSPKQYTASMIAKDYKLDVELVQHVLKHFQMLNMHVPKKVLEQDKTLLKKMKQIPSLEQKMGQFNIKISDGSKSRTS